MDKNIKFMIIRCFIPLWGIIEALKGYNLLHLKKYDVEFYVIAIQIMYININSFVFALFNNNYEYERSVITLICLYIRCP